MSSKDKRLWVGHCWLCGSPCFDVIRTFTKGVLSGQPQEIAAPLPGAKRVTMVRIRSHRLTDITLCEECEPTPDRMVELNALLNLRDRIEGSPWWHEAAERGALSEGEAMKRCKVTALYHSDPLVGELSRCQWQEIL